jgi:uncharacterized protein YgbK (DUF1537 family)
VILTVVADDLTGACDTGSLFAGLRSVPVTVWPGVPPDAPVRVVDTETRRLTPASAAARVRAAAAACPADRFLKKIDSTLRGRVGAEVDALLTAAGLRTALLCPAFPAQGRAVVDRILTVDGVPVAETVIARDPEFPRVSARGATSSVVELLRPQLDRPVAWIPLDEVRADAVALAARLERLAGTVVIADAQSDADLDALAHAALSVAPVPLLVGSAGLAQALARGLRLPAARRTRLPSGRRWLIVAGSQHPATRRQISVARQAGLRVLSTPEAEQPDRLATAASLAAKARALLERETFDLVVVTGGETAVALYAALDAERIDLAGTPAPGLALGCLRARGRAGLPVLTKAGGFGEPGLLVSLFREETA